MHQLCRTLALAVLGAAFVVAANPSTAVAQETVSVDSVYALSYYSNAHTTGAADGTLRLWEVATGRAVAALEASAGGVWGAALSLDAELVATGGADGTVRVWQVSSGRALATFQAPNGEVLGVGLSGDGRLVAIGGGDGMLRLWEPFAEDAPARTLQPERRYARTDISGLTGITDAQRATLLALGAVEQRSAANAADRG